MIKAWLLIIFILAFQNIGCTTLFVAKTNPGQAELYYIPKSNGEKKLLGATPLEISMTELKAKVGEETLPGEFYHFELVKPGFRSESFLIPASRFGTISTKVEFTLKENQKTEDDEKIAKSLIDRLFTAQRLAMLKEFERAQIEIDKILNDHPKFARAMTMRASIYFAQNNTSESIKWYEEALKIDPQMEDVIRMIAKLKGEKAPDSRLPATKATP